jgi:hypothetical protein
MFPTNVWFWVFVVLVVAAIAVYAIWSRKVQVRLGLKGLEFNPADSNAKAGPNIRVAEKAKISGILKRIVGRAGTGANADGGTIEVAKGARIDGTVDEIIGDDQNRPRR